MLLAGSRDPDTTLHPCACSDGGGRTLRWLLPALSHHPAGIRAVSSASHPHRSGSRSIPDLMPFAFTEALAGLMHTFEVTAFLFHSLTFLVSHALLSWQLERSREIIPEERWTGLIARSLEPAYGGCMLGKGSGAWPGGGWGGDRNKDGDSVCLLLHVCLRVCGWEQPVVKRLGSQAQEQMSNPADTCLHCLPETQKHREIGCILLKFLIFFP